ncbi:MAG: ABC transporter permease subunit [Candidatus Schekmanbacteria bacterium]|nr:MAG: ABC transporter permease subunit [Candidatus Schekmanbacteria bacterium]
MEYLAKALYSALRLIFGFDSETYLIVWTSLKVSLSATFFSSVIGIPIGLFVSLKDFKGKKLIQLILNTLMALPTVVVGLFFYAFLSRQGILGSLGLLYTPYGIIIGETFLALPIIANYTVSSVSGADKRLLVTCKALGATTSQQAVIILMEAKFGIIAAVVAGFGRVIAEVGVAMMLGGNIRGFTRTMTTAIALQTSKGEFELGLALGIMLLATAFAINIMLFFFQKNSKNE